MNDREKAKEILETILDRYGNQCVSTDYAEEVIMEALAEARGETFEIKAASF